MTPAMVSMQAILHKRRSTSVGKNERPSRGVRSTIEHADRQRGDQTARSPTAEIGIETGLQSLAVKKDTISRKGEIIDGGFGRVGLMTTSVVQAVALYDLEKVVTASLAR
ncbi:MAG: hypothetical protein Q9161_002171 [Pseudevernia consocians]